MAKSDSNIGAISKIIHKFEDYTGNPTSFLSPQPQLEGNFKFLLKLLYDITKKAEDHQLRENVTLPKLIIDGFDIEQVWQQIEIQNQFISEKLEKQLSSYHADNDSQVINAYPESDDGSDYSNMGDSGNSEDEDDENVESGIENDSESSEGDDDENIESGIEDDSENAADDSDDAESGIKDKEEDKSTFQQRQDGFQKSAENLEENKSTFEQRQDRLQKRVQKLEEEALAEKPWQLKGEVSAKTRPPNSLLEEVLEFDLTTRPAPIITEEAALKLEDIIIQRIKDKAWDDVERKIKPVDTPLEFKKKLVLDQEKSKLSLAKIYEQEYLKQKEAADPQSEFKEEEEPKEHTQIRRLLDSLFRKLDSLSNYHYTPLPAAPELKIVNNLPAVTLEEAIPATVSDATLLAPEEIKTKKNGELISKEERTATDKKRSRRKKKLKQRLKQKEIQKREQYLHQTKPGKNNKHGREKIEKELQKLTKNFTVTHGEANADKVSKSSKQFFERLQDTVKTGNKVKRKKETVKFDAKRIKL